MLWCSFLCLRLRRLLHRAGGAWTEWLAAPSMRLATSRCSLADMLGMTTRIMAARRRRRAIWTSCFHSCWRAFADIRCALQHDAMSATCCGARVTAGSKPGDDTRCLELAGLGFLSCSVKFLRSKAACAASPAAAAALEDATHTSTTALRL